MLKSRLPESFLSDMEELLGPGFDSYLRALEEKGASGLRVNTLKTTAERVLEKFGELERVPWTENGFYIGEEGRFTKNPLYFAGLYYIQEPSAMSSAALLGARPGERILDLCAAPGGKSTQIAADLRGEGVLFSNDLSATRAKALLKNIELMGIANAFICCEDSEKLAAELPLYFDRVLVDAPCSGEGMFRKHPAVIRAWLEHGRDFYCPVQKKLLRDAADMLRPGGTLLYSTCTYNVRENEEQIGAFLRDREDFDLDPISPRPGFTPSWILPGCIRLLPHAARAEGHFVARLKKKGEFPGSSCSVPSCRRGTEAGRKGRAGGGSGAAGLEGLREFFKKSSFQPEQARLLIQGEYVLYLPAEETNPPSLRYLRTGLLLGRLKNGRFKPSQALAMSLRTEEWADPVDLPAEHPDVLRYLRGETLSAPCGGSGYRLFCADSYPLGFVKQEGGRLKNMYLPGWRMQS